MKIVFREGNQLAVVLNEAEGHQNQQLSSILVPGYRFSPTDYVLMESYLIPKMHGRLLYPGIIREDISNVYQCQPADIPGIQNGGEFVYFFTKRDRRYEKGKRPNRRTKDQKGYWKSICKISEIHDDKKGLLGYKNTLVYFLKDIITNRQKKKEQPAKEAKEEEGVKTNWIMHEYIAAETQANASQRSSSSETLDMVICRIYYRTPTTKEKKSFSSQLKCDGGSSENHISPAPMEDKHQQAPIQHSKKPRLQQFANDQTTKDQWLISQTDQCFNQAYLGQKPNFFLNETKHQLISQTDQCFNQAYFGQKPNFFPEEIMPHAQQQLGYRMLNFNNSQLDDLQPFNFKSPTLELADDLRPTKEFDDSDMRCDPSQSYQLNQTNFGQEQKLIGSEERNEQACNATLTGEPQAFGVAINYPSLVPDAIPQHYCWMGHYTSNNPSSLFANNKVSNLVDDPRRSLQSNQGQFVPERNFEPGETNGQACSTASTGQPQGYWVGHYANNNPSLFVNEEVPDLDELCKEHGFNFLESGEYHEDLPFDIVVENDQLPNDSSSTDKTTSSTPPDNMSRHQNQH